MADVANAWLEYKNGESPLWVPSLAGAGTQSRMVLVEYGWNGMPHSVIVNCHRDDGAVSQNQYDFDYSKKWNTLYWYHSGGGPKFVQYCLGKLVKNQKLCDIWISAEIQLLNEKKVRSKYLEVPFDGDFTKFGYNRIDSLKLLGDSALTCDPFEFGEETDYPIDYCDVCNDYFPSDQQCEHLNEY